MQPATKRQRQLPERTPTYNLKNWPKPPQGSKRDKHRTDTVLVPLAMAPSIYPPVYQPMVPPNTYYRVVKETGRPACMVTVMPDDLHVAWFTCGVCAALDIHLCRCKRGITAGRSVEYIFDSIVAQLAGEEWGLNHPKYPGSLHQAERDRAPRRDIVMPARPDVPRTAVQATQTGQRAGVAVQDLDMAVINAAAATDADEQVSDLLAGLQEQTDPTWTVGDDWHQNVFGVIVPDDFDPDAPLPSKPADAPKRRFVTRKK
jgi:hypothetical protein